MPGRVKVRILNARDLPIMDRASELTDAFVEVRFGPDSYKTEVCKKSLNPQWNSEWFKFEADDEVLQDEPLDLKILDYDTYSSHDTIGKVYIDLNPLLARESPNTISGWFPIYDTMHGLRGELNVQVRVELFTDFNKFRQSSCGIQLFGSCEVPSGWCITAMLGFIEELVVNDDPEHQWIEKIRTPRASNEARQRIFSKLSGTLQRKLGVKVLEMGGNAVLGYFQNFDLEGESGIVVRAVGTAVALSKVQIGQSSPAPVQPSSVSPGKDSSLPEVWPATSATTADSGNTASVVTATAATNSHNATLVSQSSQVSANVPESSRSTVIASANCEANSGDGEGSSSTAQSDVATAATTSTAQQIADQQQQQQHRQQEATSRQSVSPVRVTSEPEGRTRRVSESEVNSPPRAGTVSVSGTPVNIPPRVNLTKNTLFQQSIDLLEYPFFTMRTFPCGFIINLGGVVSARSVKLLDKIHNPEEPQTRDAWWSELRTEIKSHALKLGCHAVLGYSENTTICDEVIVLSASGTAAKIALMQDGSSSGPGGGNSATQSTGAAATNLTAGSSASPALSGLAQGAATDQEGKPKHLTVDIGLANQGLQRSLGSMEGQDEGLSPKCSLCHIPYCPSNLPFEIQLSKCAICKNQNVPEVLFTTVDPPPEIPVWSKGVLIQARICRGRSNKNKSSEQSAREVSDILPFIEYEVHNQLINKLKIRGLNCLFGLNIQVVLGDNMIVAVGTATGAYLGPLPSPPQPVISTEVATADESQDLVTLQRRITRTVQMHRERLNSEIVERQGEHSPLSRQSTDDESDEEDGDEGNFFPEKTKDKNTFVLVVDDVKDESVSLMLHDIVPPEGFDICNTQTLPGLTSDKVISNLQMFTQMMTVKYQPHLHHSLDFSNIFNAILRRMCFKLRHFRPCCICDLSFHVDLPDEDEINVSVMGCCLGLQDLPSEPTNPPRQPEGIRSVRPTSQTDDLIFPLEGVGVDQSWDGGHARHGSVSSHARKVLTRQSKVSPQRHRVARGIELTPLNKIYNGKIERYLGYYNFFFIRESTAVREGGGIGGFLQSFLLEVNAIVRAHVSALGGNALVAYNMSQCVLDDNPHKNQGQCLINVSGDVVVVSYMDDDKDGPVSETSITLCIG